MNAARLLRSILRVALLKCPVHIVLTLLLLMLLQLTAIAQSANLDQGANDKATTPLSPVDWINGNLNSNTAHFLEGHSVPYRAILEDLVVDQTYTLVIGFDIRDGGKHALDYLTHFQRLEPHAPFGHAAETVNPLLNIAGFPPSYFTSTDVATIPAPGTIGSQVPGQPATSFNGLPAGEKQITGYNADILSITYASEGNLTAAHAETVVNITFKALKATAVLAWGGHIASIIDWGKDPVTGEPNSASAIEGSPYHMRLKNWIINGEVVTIGNQDRSLKTDAVFIPPTCDVTGPVNACIETTKLVYTATVDDPTGLTYSWSIIGANTANAKIVDPTLATIDVVPIGALFTPGTFNLQLIVTRDGLKDTCYLNSHENPGGTVTISQVIVNAGSDQTITNLDTAFLSASASGGTGTYIFTWTPVTGLNNPNIHNPQFIPPSTGVFQFIVKADDGNCQDVDTVVITVNEHPKPPCGIDGPSPVCPGSQNEYTGPAPAEVGSYLWSVTGDATLSGSNNAQKVLIKAADKCGAYKLQLIVSTPDGKRKDTCYLDVLIKDTIKPVLTGQLSDHTVSCTKDVPVAPVIGVTDNCTAELKVETSSTVTDSTCVNRYKIIRKWWATDLCNNTSDTLVQVITVNDVIKPVITAAFDKTVDIQCLKDVPAIPSPTATDNCNGNIPAVYSETGGGSKCDSTITRKWVFTDACGNSDSVTQVINIKDNIAPVLSGSVNDVNATCSKDIPAAADIKATDNCDLKPAVHFSQLVIDSTCVNKFKVIRKWWAKDACGNTSDTLTQLITVNDDIKPVITADFDKIVKIQCLKDVPAIPSPTATDNCDGNIPAVYSEKGRGSKCDSTIIRKWVFTDACGNSDSVKQIIYIKDTIATVLASSVRDTTVACRKDIPAAAALKATDNCDVSPTIYFSQKVTDSICVNKFKVIRKWWAKDACGNTSDTITQRITVYDNIKPVITAGFNKIVKVQCLKDVPANPSPTATDNCDGNIPPVYTAKGSGTKCDSTITRKWVFTDACGNSDSVKQIIYIKDTTAPVVTFKPADATILCVSPVVFGTPTFSDNCGSVTVTYQDRKEGTVCPFRYIRRWTAKDNCNNSVWVEQAITVPCCLGTFCSLTQGFYGNVNGLACTPSGTSLTAKQIMSAAVDAQTGDSVFFGLKTTGKFFTLHLADITSGNIFKMLPGGGTPAALKGYATFSKTNTWGNVPLLTTTTNYGKINNVLLSQTMALFFNMHLTPTLKDLTLQCDTILTAKLAKCGSSTPSTTVNKYVIPPSVLNYLKSIGKANVLGLYELANKYLGGETVPGVTASDVSKAVDAINNAFDQCAVLVAWKCSSSVSAAKVSGISVVAEGTKVAKPIEENTLNVTVFPNPYSNKLIFRFVAPVSGQVKLEVYNLLGQQTGQLNYGMVEKGTQHTIEYNVTPANGDAILYRLNVGTHSKTGKAIRAKE